MAKEIFDQANEVFVDDRYEEAYELYTKALADDDRTDRVFTSKLIAARGQCALKLKRYADAMNDSTNAIELDETNVKAYLRKGIALYHQEKKIEALQVFRRGLEIDASNDQLKVWQEKCEKELPEQQKPVVAAVAEAKPIPPVPQKIKHSFYQTDSVLTIQVPIKNLKRDQIHLETTDTTLVINTVIPLTGADYSLNIDLAYPIDSSRTTFNVTGSNIEIKLYKRQAIQWPSLDAQSLASKSQPPVTMSRAVENKAPSYPSSSQRAKNWDKIEAEIKQSEKDNKEEMGDANSIFQQLYRDSDENTRRAMNKSMYESGGTCLNMNWEEVSKGKIDCEPPDGMEWKKYDS